MPLSPVVWTGSADIGFTFTSAPQTNVVLTLPPGMLSDPNGGTMMAVMVTEESPPATISPAPSFGFRFADVGGILSSAYSGFSNIRATTVSSNGFGQGGSTSLGLGGEFIIQNTGAPTGIPFVGVIAACLIDTPSAAPGNKAFSSLSLAFGNLDPSVEGSGGNLIPNLPPFDTVGVFGLVADKAASSGAVPTFDNLPNWVNLVGRRNGAFSAGIGSYDLGVYPRSSFFSYNFTYPTGMGIATILEVLAVLPVSSGRSWIQLVG